MNLQISGIDCNKGLPHSCPFGTKATKNPVSLLPWALNEPRSKFHIENSPMSICVTSKPSSLEKGHPPEPDSSYKGEGEDEASARILNNSQGTTHFMAFFALWLVLTTMIWSFDSSYGGVVLVMPTFNRDFGKCHTSPIAPDGSKQLCALSPLQQSLTSLSNLFGALGSLTAGIAGPKVGRRGTMALGGSIVAIGAAGMLGTSGSYTAYLACKCLGAVGIGQIYASSSVFGVEVFPPRKRGFLMALYSIGLSLGTVAATAVCYGSSHLQNNWEWKLPILLQIPLSLILIFGTWYFPESPRWLLLKGRDEKARNSLARFFQKGPQSEEVLVQIQEIRNHIDSEDRCRKNSSWTGIFGRREIQRTLCSALVFSGLAITGQPFISTYGTLFFHESGISNPYVISFILSVCSLVGTPIGPFVVEYGGRRLSFLVGYAGIAVCMLVFSAVNTGLKGDSKVGTNVLIAFICIWVFIFAAFVAPAAWTSSAELHSLRMRTYGQAFSVWCNLILSFVMSFSTPYMLDPGFGNMGTNVGYFYFGLTAIMLGFIFFFIPETARLSLEQINDSFASRERAWVTSVQKNKKLQE